MVERLAMRTGQQLLIPEKGNGEVVSCLFAEATNNVLAGDQANVINDDSLAGSLSGPTESSGPDRLPPPFGSSGVDNDTRSVGLTPPREHGACTGEASEGELPLAGCNSPPAASLFTPVEGRSAGHDNLSAQVVTSMSPATPAALPIPSAVIPNALSDERRIALEWMEPVRHGNGTGFQLSKCGRYSVVGEHSADGIGFVFRLFERKPARLLSSAPTARQVRKQAQDHSEAS
jgi:hypothetical protein